MVWTSLVRISMAKCDPVGGLKNVKVSKQFDRVDWYYNAYQGFGQA